MIINAITTAVLLVAAVIDYRKGEIPDWLTLPCCFGLGVYRLHQWEPRYIIGAVYVSMALTILAFIFGGIGGGDLKLLTFLGLSIGFPAIGWLVFFAFLLAMVYCKLKRKKEIRMGPIILLAYLAIIVWG